MTATDTDGRPTSGQSAADGSPDRIRTGATALRGTGRYLTRWPADVQLRWRPVRSRQGCGHASGITPPAGHGYAFLDAQQELNAIAPQERRDEVAAAFVACFYALVVGGVIATGMLDLRVSLELAVGAVAVVLAATALLAAA
jgi:hypothetical protein